jgi:hypothetical protein
MRLPRQLAEDVWYEVRTGINISEPLFPMEWTAALFCQARTRARTHRNEGAVRLRDARA